MIQDNYIEGGKTFLSDENDLSNKVNRRWGWKIFYQVLTVVLVILAIAFLQSVVLGNNL